jgi:hypothetical protein
MTEIAIYTGPRPGSRAARSASDAAPTPRKARRCRPATAAKLAAVMVANIAFHLA